MNDERLYGLDEKLDGCSYKIRTHDHGSYFSAAVLNRKNPALPLFEVGESKAMALDALAGELRRWADVAAIMASEE